MGLDGMGFVGALRSVPLSDCPDLFVDFFSLFFLNSSTDSSSIHPPDNTSPHTTPPTPLLAGRECSGAELATANLTQVSNVCNEGLPYTSVTLGDTSPNGLTLQAQPGAASCTTL